MPLSAGMLGHTDSGSTAAQLGATSTPGISGNNLTVQFKSGTSQGNYLYFKLPQHLSANFDKSSSNPHICHLNHKLFFKEHLYFKLYNNI